MTDLDKILNAINGVKATTTPLTITPSESTQEFNASDLQIGSVGFLPITVLPSSGGASQQTVFFPFYALGDGDTQISVRFGSALDTVKAGLKWYHYNSTTGSVEFIDVTGTEQLIYSDCAILNQLAPEDYGFLCADQKYIHENYGQIEEAQFLVIEATSPTKAAVTYTYASGVYGMGILGHASQDTPSLSLAWNVEMGEIRDRILAA